MVQKTHSGINITLARTVKVYGKFYIGFAGFSADLSFSFHSIVASTHIIINIFYYNKTSLLIPLHVSLKLKISFIFNINIFDFNIIKNIN